MVANIRLACTNCDREDQDGITREHLERLGQTGWQDINSLSMDEYLDAEDGVWWTHLGLCPECASREGA